MVLSINPLWINRRCLFVVLYLIICKSGGGIGVFLKYFCYFSYILFGGNEIFCIFAIGRGICHYLSQANGC